jgi:hypothetical protein
MESTQVELIEKKLNQIVRIALCLQCLWVLGLFSILVLEPHYYNDAGKSLALFALLASFAVSRFYIHTGKKLEEFMTFSPEEARARKMEYMGLFFSPYVLWIGCFFIFS